MNSEELDSSIPARPWPRSRMMNVWVDNLAMRELMERMDRGVLFTLNPDHLFHLQRNRDFFNAYRQADFITSDSKYVFWALGWIGRRIKEKCSGSDVVPTYCWHHREDPEVKVFLLGAAPGVAARARERINERCGREVVIAAHSPSMKFVNDAQEIDAVIKLVNNSGATCLIVGLGAPKQEIWITQYRHLMPSVKVLMGVGATIDYEAGAVPRAPRWMTRVGLEWVYRVTTEPRRYWRRYLRDLEFFWYVLLDGLKLYRSPFPVQPESAQRSPLPGRQPTA